MEDPNSQSISTYVKTLIEGLRPKLLDLTTRNPLLSTNFSERSHSNIRVVDEVPKVLFEKLLTEKMQIIALPPLEEDPKDELTKQFKKAVIEQRFSDTLYLSEVEKLDPAAENSSQKLLMIERDLKDRVRVALQLPERQTKANLSLQQHAKNNHIRPQYDLPQETESDDGRHTDDKVQTLLLPDMLERRLNSIMSKVRTWQQETGISVFHIAFGFLEWTEVNTSKVAFAPLLLMPAVLEKSRSPSGARFYIASEGDTVEGNVVLAEMLKTRFSITLPPYIQGSLEEYFKEIENTLPRDKQWKVRRQVALGVFPSAKMAMYHDLDTSKWDFSDHELIRALFAGQERGSTELPFAEDYDVDEPEIEKKVPFLIADADSSQFSTIVDAANGKSIAVEGPPGSGKSQTIVNVISNALWEGKKVLFVAEKAAALEVVRARLKAKKLGEFLLPLMASRGSRSEIIESIRERVELGGYKLNFDIGNSVSAFKRYRTQISEYITFLRSDVFDSGFNIHEVLGRYLELRSLCKSMPKGLIKSQISAAKKLTADMIADIGKHGEELENAGLEWEKTSRAWNILRATNLDAFTAEEIIEATKRCGDAYELNIEKRSQLGRFSIPASVEFDLDAASLVIDSIIGVSNSDTARMLSDLLGTDNYQLLVAVQKQLVEYLHKRKYCDSGLNDSDAPDAVSALVEILRIADHYKLKELLPHVFDELQSRTTLRLEAHKYIAAFTETCMKTVPETREAVTHKVAMLAAIAKETVGDALAMRNPAFEDPLLADYLKRQEHVAQELRKSRRHVNQVFDVERATDPDAISSCHRTLAAAGVFRLLSREYRIARAYYRSISRDGKYDHKQAVMDMALLNRYLAENSEFKRNQKLKDLFSTRFEGIDTNFELGFRTIAFYKRVGDEFSGHDDRSLRHFLKNSPIDQIKELPRPELQAWEGVDALGYDSLLVRAKEMQSELDSINADRRSLTRNIGVLKRDAPADPQFIRDLLAVLKQMKALERDINTNSRAIELLGNGIFDGTKTNLQSLVTVRKIVDLLNAQPGALQNAIIEQAGQGRLEELRQLLVHVDESDKSCQRLLNDLAMQLICEPQAILKKCANEGVHRWAKQAVEDRAGLISYSRLNWHKEKLSSYEFDNIVEWLEAGEDGFKNVGSKLQAIIFESLVRAIAKSHGDVLSKFDGKALDGLRKNLAKHDKEIVEWSGYHIANELMRNANVPEGLGYGPKRNWTENRLIQSELSKKQRFLAPRDLTRRAGRALQALKPCWMMSPLSVSQYIEKGRLEFDLLIIDEASQMTPENAIGALSRCKQAIVVGDTNQLPPTTFFKRFVAIEEEEEEEADAVTEESILEIANLAFRPARRLRWHYRSRHSSLIAFSNKYIYKSDLTIFPSPSEHDPTMGVRYVHVDGLYKAGTNPLEAKVMIEHVANFMATHPERSLGIVTVNQSQRDLLQEEFEYAASANSSIQAYLEKWNEEAEGLESFFIKNLENVQGDERDVIFIGTVYGPESNGAKVHQRFGPINGIAGRRRLNVLFTRAKKQIVTFSSMRTTDIVADESTNPGAFLLKEWLLYSATRNLEAGIQSSRGPDSVFEEYVIKQIDAMGFTAMPQVGVSGYFVDIGVKHPKWPHGFILGVECDGASYHSSRSARDRDRLREEILAGLGWSIYRIWSTDWFENPAREGQKLREVIERKLAQLLAERAQVEKVVYVSAGDANWGGDDIPKETMEGRANAQSESTEVKVGAIDKTEAKELLTNLRDNEIEQEFNNAKSQQGILNDNMIDLLANSVPQSPSEFRQLIPLRFREQIDPAQMIYLHSILDILKRIG